MPPRALSIISIKTSKHLCLLLLSLLALTGCRSLAHKEKIHTPRSSVRERSRVQHERRISLAFTGDLMHHGSILRYAKKTNGYDYDIYFSNIKDELSSPDLTIGNLETVVSHSRAPSGYPQFNARPEYLDSLKRSGFDLLALANNHTMDLGKKGLKETITNLGARNLAWCGAGGTNGSLQRIYYTNLKGIRLAFLNYTYGVNGRKSNEMVNTCDLNEKIYNLSNIKADLTHARRKGARFIILSLHWGQEYQWQPADQNVTQARELLAAGADLIVGHHPHFLQPVEIYTNRRGSLKAVSYSLGNFLSAQKYCDSVRQGMILKVDISQKNRRIRLDRVSCVPTYVTSSKKRKGNYRIEKISDLYNTEKSKEKKKGWLKQLEYYHMLMTGVSPTNSYLDKLKGDRSLVLDRTRP